MGKEKYRKVADSMGELEVPQSALWGAQTQRAVNNFPISGICIPRQFIAALGLIKWSAAQVNNDLGLLSKEKTNAIMIACEAIIEGQHDGQFPIDIFQTGSGTSSNMNANEVIANIATSVKGTSVHPNDDVNMGQSSNDVIPTAIHIAAAIAIDGDLLPALSQLDKELESKAHEYQDVVKTGRTNLMDAMPITLSQEITGWRSQLQRTSERINDSMS